MIVEGEEAMIFLEQKMIWFKLNPECTLDHLGFIPFFMNAEDDAEAREQLNTGYMRQAGCQWRPYGYGKWHLSDDLTLEYYESPDEEDRDPPLKPLAKTTLRDETIVMYDYGLVMVLQPDGSFEVARMD